MAIRFYVPVLLLLFVLADAGRGEQPSVDRNDLQRDIRTMMVLSGGGSMAVQAMEGMIRIMADDMPDVPEVFWQRFMAKVDTTELGDLLVPMYARYFTHEEIKFLIEFYSSPMGKKFISQWPAVMQESMQIGREWGERLANKVVAELIEEGYR